MGRLLGLDRGRLAELGEAWALPADDMNPANVYLAMTDPWALGGVLERLPPQSSLVLEILQSRRGPATEEQLQGTLPFEVPHLHGLLQSLCHVGLVVQQPGTRGQAFVVPAEVASALVTLAKAGQEPDPTVVDVETLLAVLPTPELQRLALRWGLASPETLLRTELSAAVRRALTDRETVRGVVGTLSPRERRLLAAVVNTDGRAEAGALCDRLGLDELGLRADSRRLIELFLVRQCYVGGQRALFVPLGIATQAQAADSGDAPSFVAEVPGPHIGEEPYSLAWDLLGLLAYLRQADPPVTRLPLSRAEARRLASCLGAPTPEAGNGSGRQAFLLSAALGLGLVSRDGERLKPSPRAEEWENLSFPVHTIALYRWWLDTERWREGLRQSDRDLGGPIDLPAGPTGHVAALRRCRVGRWYPVSRLLSALRKDRPLLFRDRGEIAEARGSVGLERIAQHWDRLDGRLARQVFSTSLSWLGVVRLRQDDNNGGCFALTPLGAWLCGRSGSSSPALPAEASLAISANGEVIVRWPDGPAVADLYRFARRVQGSDVDHIIAAGTIPMAIRQGLSARGIIELLGRHGPVPQELVRSIRAWAPAVQRMRVRRAVLLEATDAKALTALLALPQYRGLRLRRLTDTVAVVGDEERFWASLERLGRDGFLVENPGGTLQDDAL